VQRNRARFRRYEKRDHALPSLLWRIGLMNKPLLQTIGYFGVFLTLGAVIASLGPTLPDLAANVGVGLAQIGVLFTARSFGYLAGSFVGGRLYDHFPGHRLMAALLLLAAVIMASLPAIGLLTVLIAAVFFVGFAQGGVDVGSNTLLVWTQKTHPGPYLNAMYFFAGIGSFLAPLFLRWAGLAWGYAGIALVLLPVALWLFLAPSPEIPAHVVRDEVRLTNYALFIGFAALAFLYIGVEVSYGGWIFTYFVNGGIGKESVAYTLTSVFWLSVTLGRLVSVLLATRFKSQVLLTIYLLGAILSTAVMRFLAHLPLAVWIGSVGMGLSIAAIFPTTFAFVQSKMQVSGKLNGVVWAAGSAGAMTMPWLIGHQIESAGPLSMMTIILAAWLLALAIFQWMLVKERRKQSHVRLTQS